MRFGLIFEILRSRFWLILSVLLVTLGTALAASLTMSKKYEASAVLLVDVSLFDQVSGTTVYSQQTVRNQLATQIELITSDAVVRRVVERLGFDKDQALVDEWREDTGGQVDFASWMKTGLVRKLDAEASLDGTTITLKYEAESGKAAADIVNAFAESYIEAALALKVRPVEEYFKTFDEQTAKLKQAVDDAQAKLSAFQRESGIVAADERFDTENQRLQDLATRLVQVQAEYSEAQARQAIARQRGMDVLPEVVQSPLIQTLKGEVSRVEARLGQESSKYGRNHPVYLSTVSELGELRARLNAEMQRVTGSITSSADVAARRLREIQAQHDAQRARVLELKAARDQLSILQRDRDSAQQALDLVAKRRIETGLQRDAQQSNVSIVTPAVAPLLPSRPNVVLNSVVGTVLGLFLGMIAALTLEASSRPLRSSEDLLNAAGVPILAVLPPASSTRAQRLIGSTGPTVGPGPNLRLGH